MFENIKTIALDSILWILFFLVLFWPLTFLLLIIIGIFSYRYSPKLLLAEIVTLFTIIGGSLSYVYLKQKYDNYLFNKKITTLMPNESCNSLQQKYNMKTEDFNYAPQNAKNTWIKGNCNNNLNDLRTSNLIIQDSVDYTQLSKNNNNIIASSSINNPNIIILNESCNSLQQKFTIVPGTSWGTATEEAKTTWQKGNCDNNIASTTIII